MLVWPAGLGGSFLAPPLASQMLSDGGFSAAHLHNLRALCQLLGRYEWNRPPEGSPTGRHVLAYALFKKHELPHLQLDKFNKWLSVLYTWKAEADSETVLDLLRDKERCDSMIVFALALQQTRGACSSAGQEADYVLATDRWGSDVEMRSLE